MSQIFDLTAESLKRICKLVPDVSVQKAADLALSTPSRHCRNRKACVHRLTITDEQRLGILERLRIKLAREGFEDGGVMLPIGHVYEGLIDTFSTPNRCLV